MPGCGDTQHGFFRPLGYDGCLAICRYYVKKAESRKQKAENDHNAIAATAAKKGASYGQQRSQ
jgi:hypothetical protein